MVQINKAVAQDNDSIVSGSVSNKHISYMKSVYTSF